MSDNLFLKTDEWATGASTALVCKQFKEDVEEEWVAEELVSCYNCRYRRFVKDGIVCTQKERV
ncbi:hypothetical protein Q5O24_05255 [Eubacteriaceae bacterium ES3]|nr:hypothetical protein Q5O24_05255 [Eubacteriaceae bacterium ES3]